jgi:hypothetical protein
LADVEAVAASVDAVLDRWRGAVLEVRSLLAEGADRLVTEQAMLRPGNRFVAVLPLEPRDYLADFEDPASATAFCQLLSAAASIEVSPPGPDPSREAAYERAGRAVVDTSDVLMALWDGGASRGRGGTAEMVAYARERGVPVEVVPVRRPSAAP